MNYNAPPGVRLWGEVWGRRAPLWVEGEFLYSLAGRVSRDAPVLVEVLPGTTPDDATRVCWTLRFYGYRRVQVQVARPDYEI